MASREQYLLGVKAALPVILGILPVAIAFAVLSEHSGLNVMETILMSVMVFAGASQIMALGMFITGAGFLPIIIATFILNFRHVIMGACVMNRMQATPMWKKIILCFGVTDESFAIFTTMEEKNSTASYFAGLISITYSTWVLGTVLGCAATQFLPALVSHSLGIALPAMFIGLVIPNVKKNLQLGFLVIMTALLNIAFGKVMPASWAIISATLLGAFLGSFFVRESSEEAE
jgi:4-azaleucine resistance transporter AzlC